MYLVLNAESTKGLLSEMNSKTIPIFAFIVKKAIESKNEVKLTYRDIEEALNLGHTSVGISMRLLMKYNFITKIASGHYSVNTEYLNIVNHTKVL